MGVWYGSLDIVLDRFSRIFKLSIPPHAPCDTLCVVPVHVMPMLVVT